MVSISLCMIVKNEAALLGRCLESVRAAVDEIIIVDTGSTDPTREVALRYTEKVLSFPWIDDFSAARNFAFDQATGDYQFWLDADDVLPPEELAKLLTLKANLSPDVDMVTMRYHTHFDEGGRPILTSTRERLLRRERGYRWQDPVHECIPLAGKLLHSDITVCHRKPPGEDASATRRNLAIYEGLEASGRPFTPRQQYYFARELKDHGQFTKAIRYFRRFLEGGLGWTEDNIAACFSLAVCCHAIGEEEAVLPILLQSFQYDAPRAEICCLIGYHYQRIGRYQTALPWFQLAVSLGRPESLGFLLEDYWGFIPSVESFVCAWHLGAYEKAAAFLRAAASFQPDSPIIAQNQALLDTHFAKEPATAAGLRD